MRDTLDKLVKNLVFAMGMDDEVPEHILAEIFKNNKDKGVNVEQKLETLTSIEDFNAEVSKKLQPQTEEAFFADIIGYPAIKKILQKCIQSSDREPVHVILDGPPASAKSMFLEAMRQKLKGAYYVDCTNATGPGLVEYLFNNNVKFLLLDEAEKMSKDNQNVLLNVMETGILTSTKVRRTMTKEMNLSIHATTNDIDAICKPFRSRFMEFSLPQYTFAESSEIAVKLLFRRYELSEEIALKIADTVWNKIKSKDVRDVLQVGKLSHSIDDVDFVAETLNTYKRRSEE